MKHQDSVRFGWIPVPETITWAGEFPGAPGFLLCFGTEDGCLRFGTPQRMIPGRNRVIESGEAINGVALAGDLMAISTRREVVLHKIDASGQTREVYRYDGGAHGVIATPLGWIIAPLGVTGGKLR
jgi:hypothetical protein